MSKQTKQGKKKFLKAKGNKAKPNKMPKQKGK